MIKKDSPGPAIYKHLRIGRQGMSFHLYKFRSMTIGGDDSGYMDYLKHLIESEEMGDGIPYRKMSGDARITRVGGFLRKYYLDELPQLWNILKGEMSLVGPRPHVQFEVDHYTPEQCRRLIVRPGATGLWQVKGKADCTFSELIELDLEYIENWSLGLDIKIMLQTLLLMARGGEGFWARMVKRIPSQGRSRVKGLMSKDPEVVNIDSQPLAREEE
jgi:lipopolysaccharide/colanic/teichoic acid biosynthesis glycosyltransferase